jgi:anti-sigma regulatory factor (Ser/Thr protein kinase)
MKSVVFARPDSMNPVGEARAKGPGHGHIVQFYSHDDELIAEVVSHLSDAVALGGTAIAIATREHRLAFEAGLAEAVDLNADSNLTLLDAYETLQQLLSNDELDEGQFRSVIGALVSSAKPPVHLYGEMVDLLWEAGRVPDAIELESLWNRLGEEHLFVLLCGYSNEAGLWNEQAIEFSRVCDLHASVVGTAASDADASHSEATGDQSALDLPRLRSSVRSARAFVREALSSASDTERDKAELIVSELVTNALEHGKGEIVVRVIARDREQLISVDDDEPTEPVLREIDPGSARGRGVLIVDRLSSRWGVAPTRTGGKSVWAVIDREGTADRK